jgi:uncharacterized protein (DUF1697 family)
MLKSPKRYVAFLRGVSPLNAKMPALKRAFEEAGFEDVRTVLGSGNVLFSAEPARSAALARRAEAAMQASLGASFFTIVRSVDELRKLLKSDPFRAFRLAKGSKRVVTFLSERPNTTPKLPIVVDGARILVMSRKTVLTAYVARDKAPLFMALIERTFGKRITTRTWETVSKCAK